MLWYILGFLWLACYLIVLYFDYTESDPYNYFGFVSVVFIDPFVAIILIPSFIIGVVEGIKYVYYKKVGFP